MKDSNYYTDMYYNDIYGEYPGDGSYEKTKIVFDYLTDTGISSTDIIVTIHKLPNKEYITFDDLPNSLWEGSLIKRDTFYYHNILHLKQEMPTWNPITNVTTTNKFFIEMKIRFTIDNLVDYFYKTLKLNSALREDKKDIGAINYLLNKYGKFTFVEPLDFMLSLIDYVRNNVEYGEIFDILSLQNSESEVYEKLKPMCEEAESNGRSKIIWRTAGS